MHDVRRRPRVPFKKPIIGRFLCLILSCAPAPALAQTGLTEDEAVSKALERADFDRMMDAQREVGEGASVEASYWDNPTLSYQREQLSGAPADLDAVMLSQRFDLSGRRSLRRDAALARIEGQLRSIEWARRTVEAQVREQFHAVLRLQARIEALDAWLGHLEGARDIIKDRAEAGDVPALSLQRIESALALARVRRASEVEDRDRTWAALEALAGDLDDGDWPRANGALMPPEASEGGSGMRADLVALEREIEALELEAQAAGRGWMPELEVGLGYLRQTGGGEEADGFTIAVGLSLPVFSRGQGAQRLALGQSRLLAVQRQVYTAQAERHLEAARESWTQRRALAASFEVEVERAESMAALARDAYEGDALVLGELLNIYEHLSDIHQEAIELRWRARQAQLEARRLQGGQP